LKGLMGRFHPVKIDAQDVKNLADQNRSAPWDIYWWLWLIKEDSMLVSDDCTMQHFTFHLMTAWRCELEKCTQYRSS
jgi:hypothetical protein